MAAPPAAPDTQVETRADEVPDCSWPAHPARLHAPAATTVDDHQPCA